MASSVFQFNIMIIFIIIYIDFASQQSAKEMAETQETMFRR